MYLCSSNQCTTSQNGQTYINMQFKVNLSRGNYAKDRPKELYPLGFHKVKTKQNFRSSKGLKIVPRIF